MTTEINKLLSEGMLEGIVDGASRQDKTYQAADALATLVQYCFAHGVTVDINPRRDPSGDTLIRFEKTINDKQYAQAAVIPMFPTMGFDPDDFLLTQTCCQVLRAIESDLLDKYGKED